VVRRGGGHVRSPPARRPRRDPDGRGLNTPQAPIEPQMVNFPLHLKLNARFRLLTVARRRDSVRSLATPADLTGSRGPEHRPFFNESVREMSNQETHRKCADEVHDPVARREREEEIGLRPWVLEEFLSVEAHALTIRIGESIKAGDRLDRALTLGQSAKAAGPPATASQSCQHYDRRAPL
jgi:hypothetical protein